MKIIHIAPLQCAEAMHKKYRVDMAMCLTHLVEKNPEYRDFYHDFGGYKILDNSLIELGSAVGLQRVLEAAREIRAQEIILPDVFRDAKGTIQAVTESIEYLRENNLLGRYKLMAVAQGADVPQWVACFKALEQIPEVDVIGIPKITAKLQPGGRPALESIWKNSSKVIHLLGLWYTFGELGSYAFPDRIRSVDTCQAAFLAKYHMGVWDVRPDGFTIDLEDSAIYAQDFLKVLREVE